MPAALNVEFKARCRDLEGAQQILEALGARFAGLDHQRDTYFAVPQGRLKLRQGTVETALIHYERGDTPGLKRSHVTLYHPADAPALLQVLSAALEVDVVVEKWRRIYFVDNVKIHLDRVAGLGTFVEVEAISTSDEPDADALHAQCEAFRLKLGVEAEDLLSASYSDLLRALLRDGAVGQGES